MVRRGGGTAPAAAPHYVLGQPYQTGGVWRYPREQFAGTDTGLAVVASRQPGLTADGEVFDQGVLAAAHRTLQLPALARVTDLGPGGRCCCASTTAARPRRGG